MQTAIASECPYLIEPLDGVEGALPLIVQAMDDPDPVRLHDWLQRNDSWVQEQLTAYGALLFRGFDFTNQAQFHYVEANLRVNHLAERFLNLVFFGAYHRRIP